MSKTELEAGDKVHYESGYKNPENGMIKSVGTHTAFVVFHCDGDWDNFLEYTGVRCDLDDLKLGWVSK